MAKEASLCLLFFSSLLISSSGALVDFSYFERGRHTHADAGTRSNKVSSSDRDKIIGASYVELMNTREDFEWKEVKIRREIQRKLIQKRRNVDERITNTVYPTPTTVITPSDTPTIITVPSSTNPVTISPTNPATAVPVNVPSSTTTPTVPAPVPVPVPVVTNPVTTSYPPPSPSTSTSGNVPVPVPVTNPQAQPPPSSSQGGQSWCVAKTGAAQASLQSALDYACGMGGADCSQIQQGGSCFSPITLQNHASFAFNSYYQKNPSPTSCDFGGAATLVNTNPSSGSCIFPSSSSSSSSTTAPMISSPTPPTPTQSNSTPPPSLTTPSPSIPTTYPPSSIPIAPPTSSGSGGGTSGYGSPPSVLNSSNPASSGSGGVMPAGFGSDSPPVVNTTSGAHSLPLKPLTGCIVLIISFVTAKLSLLP